MIKASHIFLDRGLAVATIEKVSRGVVICKFSACEFLEIFKVIQNNSSILLLVAGNLVETLYCVITPLDIYEKAYDFEKKCR